MYLSVIIPTFNEAENLKKLLPFLIKNTPKMNFEIIVSDGGSTDDSIAVAKSFGVTAIHSPKKGRAAQMNYGVVFSKGDVLQFIHADTLPPKDFYKEVETAMSENYPCGCFTYLFDSSSIRLKINAYFTKFNLLWCRGGDQAIFITKKVFEEFKGYREDFLIMEEYDLLKKIQPKYPFKIVRNNALVSARKYEENSYWRVQLANLTVFNMYRLGYSQAAMVRIYGQLLRKNRLPF
jgi:rSAM/selenodomain-associated transferase 2